jgi:hypothetical protein
MARPHDRPAVLAALASGIVVLSLPAATVYLLSLLASSSSNSGTTVVGVDPDRARVVQRQLQVLTTYFMGVSPFAMAAAWRTFVRAKRWLANGDSGWQGIFEGAACGFAGAIVILFPGIVTRPLEAPAYVIAYGGLAAVVGLVIGAVVWVTASTVLRVWAHATRSGTSERA